MEARVKFNKDTLSQTGSIGKLLMWMQDNPKHTRNTNLSQMAKTFCTTNRGKTDVVAMTLKRMLNNELITRCNGIRRATFFINYYSPQIPGYIIDRAPKKDKERIERIKKLADANNKYVDGTGCVVTKKEDKPEEVTTESQSDLKIEETDEPSVTEETNVSSDMSEENTTSIPVEIRETEHGISISITLNLNINK